MSQLPLCLVSTGSPVVSNVGRSGFSFIRFLFCLVGLSLGIHATATETISNGGFESGSLAPWEVNDWSNNPNMAIAGSVESGAPLAGNHSAKLEVSGTTDPVNHEHWELNFRQIISVQESRYYEGSFTVRASEECSFWVQVYKTGGNYDTFVFEEVTVSTEPQTFRFGGVANFTSHPKKPGQQATLQIGFGKTKRGATVWLDDISFEERAPGPSTAAVTVDLSVAETETNPLSGLLLGLDLNDPTSPAERWVAPLQPTHWRTNWNLGYVGRVASTGALPIVLVSENKYPGSDPANPANPAPWSDNYVSWSAHCTQVAQDHGNSVIYDLWNEPDMDIFFLNWANADFDKFLETFKHAHDAIRAEVPDAVISGPSLSGHFDWVRLDRFMDYCLAEGLSVQILSLHLWQADQALEGMRDDLLEVRSRYVDDPAYAAVGLEAIHVNEYANWTAQRMRPGSILGVLRFLETGGADAACRSCWEHSGGNCAGVTTCFDGSLTGLLNCDLDAPRAVWWAYKWYAEGMDSRVSATSDHPEVVPLASAQSGVHGRAQVLVASRGYSGEAQDMSSVTVQLDNLVASGLLPAGSTDLYVSVDRVAYSGDGSGDVVAADSLIADQVVSVTNDSATITLTDLNAYDAQRVTFGATRELLADGFEYGTVNDAHADWTGHNYNPQYREAGGGSEGSAQYLRTAVWPNDGGQLLAFFDPTTLAVGESLEMRWRVRLAGFAASANLVRIGLYDSNGSYPPAGGAYSDTALNAYRGYGFWSQTRNNFAVSGQISSADFRKRGGNSNVLVSAGAHSQLYSNTSQAHHETLGIGAWSPEQVFRIARTATGWEVTTILGGLADNATYPALENTFQVSDASPFDEFDAITLWYKTGDVQTALDIDAVRVIHTR